MSNPVKAAMAVAEAFIDAFNAQDHERLAATMNYPHIRLADDRYVIFETPEDFLVASQHHEPYLQKEGWHHTELRSINAVHTGERKVHLALVIDRCHEDGTVYNQFDTLWIATLDDGHWGIQFRSSYLRRSPT